jgi:3-isopropylmalate/(R)-2-methylmalate dehydratase small subunit
MCHDLRHDASARPRADFALNLPAYRGARILVGNHNFGCGSSRESAVTVMVDNGFQVFIAPSFGDIFFSNCFQHGALPIRLPTQRVDAIRALLHSTPGAGMTIDLHAQQVLGPDGLIDRFEIDAFRKECLLLGTDAVGLTLGYATQIADYEQRHPRFWS